MQNKMKRFLLVCGIALCGTAFAESASDSLTRIEAETLLLKAREKQLDVQANIIARQNEIAAKQVVHDQLTQAPVVGDPVVRSVEGIGRKVFAMLQMSTGDLIEVQAGDTLPNGMKVVSIRSNEVIVAAGKKRRVRLATIPSNPGVATAAYPAANSPNFSTGAPPALPMSSPKGALK